MAYLFNDFHWSKTSQEKESYNLGLSEKSNILKNVLKGFRKMSDEKGNLKGLAISFILISLIMGAGVGIVYFIGQSIY